MPAPAPPPENGAPRSELEQVQMRAGQVTDEVTSIVITYYANSWNFN